jgi:hypothetical protein
MALDYVAFTRTEVLNSVFVPTQDQGVMIHDLEGTI